MNTGMEYGASWSLPLTLRMVVTMFFAPFVAVGIFVGLRVLGDFRLELDLAIAALPVAYAIAYMLRAIRGFALSRDAVFVRRFLWTTVEPLSGLRSATIDTEALAGIERLRTRPGGFGIGGWYWSAQFGRFRGYLTNVNRPVVLTLERGVIILSPDDPDAFVRHLDYFRGLRRG